jgi:hypothetical protein
VASVLHRGRKTQVVQTRVETGQGKVVAFVTQTQLTLYAESGRSCDDDYLARNRLEEAAS